MRYDGSHKRDAFLNDRFGKYVEWVPVCPEVESGMSTPRDFLKLIDRFGEVRMVTPATGQDHTDQMRLFAIARIQKLLDENLSGYIFKSKSPSCGIERIDIYKDGLLRRKGKGLFATEFMSSNPTLPVEDEVRLRDPCLRENFVSRMFSYNRWQKLGQLNRNKLVKFHAAHELLLMAHSRQGLLRLGEMLGQAGTVVEIKQLVEAYWLKFSEIMKKTPPRRNHVNVLRYILGVLSEGLEAERYEELTVNIEKYRSGIVPLMIPMNLLRQQVSKPSIHTQKIRGQVYLDPHPDELMLLNEI